MPKKEPRIDPATGIRLTANGMPDRRYLPGRPKNKGRGPSKKTISIREMIEGALHELGGQRWLRDTMKRYPTKAMDLIAKVMPHQLLTEHHEFQYVIQKISMDSGPVAGVIRDGVSDYDVPEVERLQ